MEGGTDNKVVVAPGPAHYDARGCQSMAAVLALAGAGFQIVVQKVLVEIQPNAGEIEFGMFDKSAVGVADEDALSRSDPGRGKQIPGGANIALFECPIVPFGFWVVAAAGRGSPESGVFDAVEFAGNGKREGRFGVNHRSVLIDLPRRLPCL